ncbi:oxidase cueO precursor [Lindgomyces ingoldianus]|uniref:Oxidase cueO n=1 Tax=Lindgomyces ingoldianus TaxID=673940 RepID=A0ACB6QK81_9PLEO|nr:oxidase cueO precursor [Lindgomyces ingoldianus]KAF2467429.1 oxidase cueO precursor [Lindgomyces ingoldianus]
MTSFRSLVVASLLSCQAFAGDKDWLSPVYKDIFQNPLPFPPNKAPKYQYTNASTGATIDYYEIEIKAFEQQVYPGLKPAKLVGYDGISPGPTFRMERGREAVVRFVNHGEKDISVHLHGSYSRAPFDGWAEDTTKVGQYKDYYYPNKQSARTLWYHDHAVHHTAENAYFGQAGFYILHDPAEDALNLPAGDYDIPLALASKQYNKDGTLFDPKDETVSLYGDVIHVNGQPWPYFKVEPRKYRLRFLDTSISRAFQLWFEADGALGKKIPFQMIASDAGLMTKPVQSDLLHISMAERWEMVFDFSAYAGKNVTLRNNRDVQADEDYNSTNQIMRFIVGKDVKSQQGNGNLPSSLRTVPFPPLKSGVDRTFKFERTNGEWKVNGVSFSDVKNRILAKPQRGQVEVWDLVNGGGGWSHPVHIHLIDMQIISRTGGRSVLPYEKEALKDVVLLGTSETVRVIARYAPWDGVYMFHCHNLIHEDHDMMAAFNVSSLGDWGYPETTHFIDPMEQQYRSKDEKDSDFEEEHIKDRLNEFYLLDAYKDVDKVEEALVSYWENGGAKPTTFATSVKPSTISTAAARITSAPAAATTTKKSEDKPKTTTKKN